MIKKLLFLPFFFLCVVTSQMASAAPVAVLSPQSQSASVGQTLNVSVNARDVVDLYAWQFDVSFDTSILQLTRIMEGAWSSATGNSYFLEGMIDPTDGVFRGTVGGLFGPGAGLVGSGSLAEIEFRAVGSGEAAVTLENVVFLDSSLSDLRFDVSNATVTVAGNTVPEPSVLGLVALGLGLTVAMARTRRTARRSPKAPAT